MHHVTENENYSVQFEKTKQNKKKKQPSTQHTGILPTATNI